MLKYNKVCSIPQQIYDRNATGADRNLEQENAVD